MLKIRVGNLSEMLQIDCSPFQPYKAIGRRGFAMASPTEWNRQSVTEHNNRVSKPVKNLLV